LKINKQIANNKQLKLKEMNVLSTFNGMGCIWYALDRLNIKVNKRYSCEIDKYANQANNAAYPDTIQLGDVTKVKAEDLAKIDLFVGGSPCQGFSFAGKQLNFNDPRSALFFEFVRIWNEIKKINPEAKFLLENVNMKKEHLRVISEYMDVFPVRINSNLVSAQNRDRWYWTNIRTKETGLFSELWSDIPRPKDKGILLKDILQPESEIDDKYYLSQKMIKSLLAHAIKRKQIWTFFCIEW
jgi:DNA (cytosine-5)-methyltransferase 3A